MAMTTSRLSGRWAGGGTGRSGDAVRAQCGLCCRSHAGRPPGDGRRAPPGPALRLSGRNCDANFEHDPIGGAARRRADAVNTLRGSRGTGLRSPDSGGASPHVDDHAVRIVELEKLEWRTGPETSSTTRVYSGPSWMRTPRRAANTRRPRARQQSSARPSNSRQRSGTDGNFQTPAFSVDADPYTSTSASGSRSATRSGHSIKLDARFARHQFVDADEVELLRCPRFGIEIKVIHQTSLAGRKVPGGCRWDS
jgi:hypothetical protein